MKIYAHFGVRDFIICAGYRSDYILDYFMRYRYAQSDVKIDLASGAIDTLGRPAAEELNWRVIVANTGEETLTGLRVSRIQKYINHDRFFLTYGDGVGDVDIAATLSTHIQSGKKATICGVRPSSRFGELSIESGIVTSFKQKPQVTEGWVNGGFMVIDTDALSQIPPGADVALEEGFLAPLSQRHEVGIYQHSGFWQCMDTYREMELLEGLWRSNKAPWKVW